MELSPLYLQRLEEATQKGTQQVKRQFVESILQVRFGEIDAELVQIIEPLIQLEPLEMTRLSMHLDRSHLLARFHPNNPTES